jgi:NADH dehydrogenase FAD-containing subunit
VVEAVLMLELGLLAYVGGGHALSQIQVGDVPIRSYAGSTLFVLWWFVYLMKQVATRNRFLITFDWIKTYLFGRDITRL